MVQVSQQVIFFLQKKLNERSLEESSDMAFSCQKLVKRRKGGVEEEAQEEDEHRS